MEIWLQSVGGFDAAQMSLKGNPGNIDEMHLGFYIVIGLKDWLFNEVIQTSGVSFI